MPLHFLKRPVLLALSLASLTGLGCAEEAESTLTATQAAITVDTTATYQLVGMQSGKCVDVPNGSSTLAVSIEVNRSAMMKLPIRNSRWRAGTPGGRRSRKAIR